MKWLLWVIIIHLLSIGIIQAQDDTTTCPDNFEGYLPPRLIDAQSVRILADDVLNLRSNAGLSSAILIGIPQYTTIPRTSSAPKCADGLVWWEVEYAEVSGWLAEGEGEEYWLEGRGKLSSKVDGMGVERWFVELPDGSTEPEGCLRPPDNYERIELGDHILNTRTLFMLNHAEHIYTNMRDTLDFEYLLLQGSYNPRGTIGDGLWVNERGGELDLSIDDIDSDEIPYIIEALRIAGFAAWSRQPSELYADSIPHIHAVAIGDEELSDEARDQIDGNNGYLRGFNGLPPSLGSAKRDLYGGPIICGWMVEINFTDLRQSESQNPED